MSDSELMEAIAKEGAHDADITAVAGNAPMNTLPIPIPADAVAEFCRRYRVRRLALFGSVLRDDFRPESDVDVLAEFEPGCAVGLITLAGMEIELSGMLGRKVDLNTVGCLSKYFVDEVLREAVPVYVAA